jgi:hypothetical protein
MRNVSKEIKKVLNEETINAYNPDIAAWDNYMGMNTSYKVEFDKYIPTQEDYRLADYFINGVNSYNNKLNSVNDELGIVFQIAPELIVGSNPTRGWFFHYVPEDPSFINEREAVAKYFGYFGKGEWRQDMVLCMANCHDGSYDVLEVDQDICDEVYEELVNILAKKYRHKVVIDNHEIFFAFIEKQRGPKALIDYFLEVCKDYTDYVISQSDRVLYN